jgi:DNA invertase Pin-like site-specific DNA recombinase
MSAVQRVAVYARFSSELQRATSIDDQVAVARRYADEQGWSVLPDHVYTDAAISGASLDRPGIQALRTAVTRRPLPFDVVLVDDSSRVSRDLSDAVRLLQELRFNGVRVIYISQHIDSANDQAETLVAVHGVVDSLYLKEMAKKIKRGLAGQLDRGFATGSITFGYRTVPVPDPSGALDMNGYPVLLGKRVEIVPEEARIVVQIFEWYADGLGIGSLTERLNRQGFRGPRGRRWRAGPVRYVLDNERYLGRLVWGRTTQERRPGTSQHVTKTQPRDSWRVQERPELRVVSDVLWSRVRARRAAVRATLQPQSRDGLMRGRNAALHSRHLFSGFMRCGQCDGPIVVVTGGYGSPRYGCLKSWHHGRPHCANRVTTRAKIVDAHLLAALKRELLAPGTVQYVTDTLSRAINARIANRPQLLADAQRERQDTKERLQRLVDAIENGVPASSVAGAISERQGAIERLDGTIAALSEPLHQRLAVMPTWVSQQLEDLTGLLSDTPERTKVQFQALGLKVTMHPRQTEDGKNYYQADVVNSLPWLAGITDIRGNPPSTTDATDPPEGW